MAELTLDLRREPKHRAYPQLLAQLIGILEGIDDEVAMMATISSVVHHAFAHLWTGFYRVVSPDTLRVGPYQGTLGCMEIAFGRGVCGVAAAERRTLVVPDVSLFPGHITCDARSRSEIVVPVMNSSGTLVAVFDIDSDQLARFDQEDANGLEQIVNAFFSQPRG